MLSALLFALAQAAAPSPVESAAIFRAAGATRRGNGWILCAEDPTNPRATIAEFRDLNGDGRPEALVTEDGTFCNGHAGTGYALLSKQANGSWRVMTGGSGIAEFLPSKGAGGWPDISIGGPGFCFPVERWNGREYAFNRHQYEGKACRPPR